MKTQVTIKIFVDAHVFDGKYQGSRTFIKEIYNILAAKEDVQLYLGAYDTGNLQQYFAGNENIHFVRYRSRSAFIRLIYDIPSIIKKHGIQYAHFQYIIPPLKNCRFIVTTHDLVFNESPQDFPLLYRLFKNFLFKRSAKKADILTTVSSYSKRSIQKFFKLAAQKIHVIPNGVSNLFFADYDKENAKQYIKSKFGIEKIILLVSRLEPRKNHMLLLQAFAELKLYEQGHYLVFLGWHENIKNKAFDTMMKNLPEACKSYIFMQNTINDNDLLQFYRAAQVFVYPSRAEGFGIPPLEAAAVKIPVLCSNISAMSDFDFFGAFHFDPANYPVFKNKLGVLLNAVPGKTDLENLAATVQQQYDWKKSAETLYQLIKTDAANSDANGLN